MRHLARGTETTKKMSGTLPVADTADAADAAAANTAISHVYRVVTQLVLLIALFDGGSGCRKCC